MKVTYIYHSGFAVELEEHVLLFDYYKGELPEFDRQKRLVVFASHFHQDHFSKDILKLQENYPDVRYILANDIRRKIPKEKQRANMTFLKKREMYEDEDISVQTFRSTDEGSAFLVRCEARTIYHAGDLNWWHWEEESEKYNSVMESAYKKEVVGLSGQKIDVAFVVLDPRQEEQFFWGFDWFMRHTNTEFVFPMHMWEQYQVCQRLLEREESKPYRSRVQKIGREGQSFIIGSQGE